MNEQVDVIGEILDKVNEAKDRGEKPTLIVVHDVSVWARLPEAAGAQWEHGALGESSKLFGIPVGLGSQNDSARFTVKTTA